jgi:hypothetical protein
VTLFGFIKREFFKSHESDNINQKLRIVRSSKPAPPISHLKVRATLFGCTGFKFSTANHTKALQHTTEPKQEHLVTINIHNFIIYNNSTRYKLLQHYFPLSFFDTGQRGVPAIFKVGFGLGVRWKRVAPFHFMCVWLIIR